MVTNTIALFDEWASEKTMKKTNDEKFDFDLLQQKMDLINLYKKHENFFPTWEKLKSKAIAQDRWLKKNEGHKDFQKYSELTLETFMDLIETEKKLKENYLQIEELLKKIKGPGFIIKEIEYFFFGNEA